MALSLNPIHPSLGGIVWASCARLFGALFHCWFRRRMLSHVRCLIAYFDWRIVQSGAAILPRSGIGTLPCADSRLCEMNFVSLRRGMCYHLRTLKVEETDLLDSLSLSPEEYRKICARLKRAKLNPVRTLNPSKNKSMFLNLEYLESRWLLDADDQRKVVVAFPSLLSFPNAQLKHKLEECSRVLGFVAARNLLLKRPKYIAMSVEDTLKPLVTYYKAFGFSMSHFRSIVVRRPRLLFMSIEDRLHPQLERFLAMGLSKEEIIGMVKRDPGVLACNLKDVVEPKILWLKNVVGLSRNTIVHKMVALHPRVFTGSSLTTIERNFKWIRQLKVSKASSASLTRQRPFLLCNTSESKIQKMEFVVKVLGKKPEDMLKAEVFVRRSFDRVLARCAFLDLHNFDYKSKSLYHVFQGSDQVFLKSWGELPMHAFVEFCNRWDGLSHEEKMNFFQRKDNRVMMQCMDDD